MSVHVDKYMNEITQLGKPLTKKQEKKATDDELIKANLRYVVKVAHQYKNMGLSLEDLIQEGNLGLLEALKSFDRNANKKFITYAVYYIKLRIRTALTTQNNTVHQSSTHLNRINKVEKFVNQFFQKHSRKPTVSEIAKGLDIKEKLLKKTLSNKVNNVVDLNKKVGENQDTEIEEILDFDDNNFLSPDKYVENEDLRKRLYQIIDQKLNETEKFIVTERYLNERTLEEIGADLGYTPAGILSLQNKILKKLKRHIN